MILALLLDNTRVLNFSKNLTQNVAIITIIIIIGHIIVRYFCTSTIYNNVVILVHA